MRLLFVKVLFNRGQNSFLHCVRIIREQKVIKEKKINDIASFP